MRLPLLPGIIGVVGWALAIAVVGGNPSGAAVVVAVVLAMAVGAFLASRFPGGLTRSSAAGLAILSMLAAHGAQWALIFMLGGPNWG